MYSDNSDKVFEFRDFDAFVPIYHPHGEQEPKMRTKETHHKRVAKQNKSEQ